LPSQTCASAINALDSPYRFAYGLAERWAISVLTTPSVTHQTPRSQTPVGSIDLIIAANPVLSPWL